MPRPKKRRDGVVRSIRQPVAFSFAEYGQLQRNAYDSNVSVSELIRFRALTRKVKRPPEPPLLNEQLYKELNSLGIDLNQATHKVNAAISVDIDPSRYIDKVKELNSRLSDLLSQINTGLETADYLRLPIESRKVGQSQSERRLSVRLAPDEYETIKQKARKAKVTIPQFIRRAALLLQVTQLPPPPVINWKLYKELGSINVNLRQLAKKLPTIADTLLELIELLSITQISLVGASNTSEDD
ncbi:MAG TPA: ribbon-helix-helix protein, CopG family [Allocoleopsis sp.]